MPSKTYEYQQRTKVLRAEAIASGADCLICRGAKGPIVYDYDPRNPLCFTVNHRLPSSLGGTDDMSNLEAPVHAGCNSGIGNGVSRGKPRDLPTSRKWL